MTGTAATPGQAAYEAYRADLASRLAWSADEIYAFSSLSDEEREGWEGIAQAAIAAQDAQPAPEVAGERPETRALRELHAIADRAGWRTDAQPAPELAAAEAKLRETAADNIRLREQFEALRAELLASAEQTRPSKKSQIELSVARTIARILDGQRPSE